MRRFSSFRVIRLRRLAVSLAKVALTLALFLAMVTLGQFFWVDYSREPALATVRPGVSLVTLSPMGPRTSLNLGGLTASQLTALLGEIAPSQVRPATDAYIDPVTLGKVPGLPGWALDVEATARAVLEAAEGAQVNPIFRPFPPAVRLEDLPPAPIYGGNPARTEMALMINIGTGGDYLPAILDTLDEHGVRVSFCLVGVWAEAHPHLVHELVCGGHEVGNHGYAHLHPTRVSPAQLLADTTKGAQLIQALIGAPPAFFQPAYGEWDLQSVETLQRELGLETVLWTIDTVDWKRPPVQRMYEKVMRLATGGAIVLMHPTETSVELLRLLIPALRQKGHELIPVSELIAELPGQGR
ncbi:MAG: polysaccharide deacetylase family protein [Bacillota bacterium]